MLNVHTFALKAVMVAYCRDYLELFQSLVRLLPALTSFNATSRTHVLCLFMATASQKSHARAYMHTMSFLLMELLSFEFLLLNFQTFYYIYIIFFHYIYIFSIGSPIIYLSYINMSII